MPEPEFFFQSRGLGFHVPCLPFFTEGQTHILKKKLDPDLEFRVEAGLYNFIFSFAPGQNHAICTFNFYK